MLNVSDYFLDSIGRPAMLDLKGTITTSNGNIINWDKSNIVRDSFSIVDKCVKGSTFSIGSINSATLNATMYLEGISAYSLVGQTIKAYYGCEGEYIILGTFEIVKASQKNTNCISITGSTQLNRLNYNDDKENLPSAWLGTSQEPYYVLESLCTHANVNFANSIEEIRSLPNGTIPTGLQEDCTISSTSELISYLASWLGAFVTSDRETGGIKLDTFKKSPCYTVPLRTIYRGTLSVAGFPIEVICTRADFYENGAKAKYCAVGRPRQSVNDIVNDLTDNPFCETVYLNNDKNLDYVIDREIEIGLGIECPYNPFNLSMAGNPALELGDCINIELPNGNYLTSVISYSSFNFRGQHTLKCIGEDGRTVGGIGITDTLRLEEHLNRRINSVSRTPLMKKSEYQALGDNWEKNVLYCLCDDEEEQQSR